MGCQTFRPIFSAKVFRPLAEKLKAEKISEMTLAETAKFFGQGFGRKDHAFRPLS